jgi:choline dehydrogenase
MHQAGANSEDSISAIEPINTSSSHRGDIVRHLHLEQSASANFTERVRRNQQNLTAELKPHYDFIVWGSGSSGSVVVRGLAENPDVSVLLLEAGGRDDVPGVTESVKWFDNLETERDWGFVSQPNQNLKGRSIPLNMGKVLGRGSSINVMAWARGHKTDWDFFAPESGDPAWNYDSVLSIYRRSEDWRGAPDPRRRGTGKLVFVQAAPDQNPIAPAMVEAARSIGMPTFDSNNGVLMEGDAALLSSTCECAMESASLSFVPMCSPSWIGQL